MRKMMVMLLAALMVVSVACSDDEPTADEGDANGEILVLVEGEPEENRVYETLIDQFNKDNPDTKVALVQSEGREEEEAEDMMARLTAAFAAGDPPEIFLINYREYSQFVAQGAVEPIGPLLEEDGVDLSGYYDQPIDAFTFDGELQCMPQNISSLVVYYNADIFDEAGIERPADDWGWADFRDTALELKKQTGTGLALEPKIIRLAPFIWGNGGEVVDSDESPTRFTLDDPASREAVEFVVSLARDDKVIPTEEEVQAEGFEDQFVSGDVAMYLGSRKDTPKFREVVGFNWDVLALPTGKQAAGILHSDAYCISKGTENIQGAADFIEFATGEEGETLGAFSGRVVPSLRSVAEGPAFLDPSQPPEHSSVFIDGIEAIRHTPVLPTWPEIESATDELLTRLFYEPGYTYEDFLRELDEATTPLFEEGAA
jgi:multiple sugar transport system substrate-binding protein